MDNNFQFSIFPASAGSRLRRDNFQSILNFKFKILNSWRSQAAFTIIELLVSSAVIFLLLGFAFAGYARFNQRQTLTSSGQTMKNILRDAQSRAYSGELDCSNCDCSITAVASLKGWYVDFSNKQIYGECLSSVPSDPPITFSPRPFNLPSEIVITPYITPPTTKIKFRSNPTGVDQQATICLSNINFSGLFYAVQVTSGGEISDAGDIKSSCP